MFHTVKQGDRVGMCVTQFDPKQLERGLVCTPGVLPTISAAVVSVQKIPYFKSTVNTKAKFHITLGHETVMGKAVFFGLYEQGEKSESFDGKKFDFTTEYMYQDELIPETKSAATDKTTAASGTDEPGKVTPQQQFAVLELEKPVTCPANSIVIGSKLDTDIHSNVCRLAFHGHILEAITEPKYMETVLPSVKVYKNKSRQGVVERKADEYSVICKGLFKKESNIDVFIGLKVKLSTGEEGVIESSFGQSGKFKVRIPSECLHSNCM